MNDKARFERHALNLGKLLGMLQSIEMGSRMAIVKLDKRAADQVQSQLPQLRAGDMVEINALTNSDDLRQTLEKYNKRASLDRRIEIEPIVNLRDALAHGRAFGFGSVKPLRLLKFSRKTKGEKILIELALDMTDEWFGKSIKTLEQALEQIRKTLDYERREFR